MKEKQSFKIHSLIIILLINAIFLTALFVIAWEAVGSQVVVLSMVGLVFSLVLWFVLQRQHDRLGSVSPEPVAPAPAPKPVAPKPAPPQLSPAPALQLLSLFQREGRLIDFLQEDLSQYDDAQIGAAVRSIHAGCKKALSTYVTLEPIYTETEGSEVTIAPGFDAHAVRLVGNVAGEPPFRGALLHRGWRVAEVDLPKLMQGQEQANILAAAEVEVKG